MLVCELEVDTEIAVQSVDRRPIALAVAPLIAVLDQSNRTLLAWALALISIYYCNSFLSELVAVLASVDNN